jgi:mono/diheme cytochrome c family protein
MTRAGAALACAVVAWAAALAAAQEAPPGVFTAEQATAGKAAYAKNCASCHMPDLSGDNEIPALAGETFSATWDRKSTKDLFDYISAAMPYGKPSLKTEEYESITAYILQTSGAAAGTEPLRPATDVPIRRLVRASRPGS